MKHKIVKIILTLSILLIVASACSSDSQDDMQNESSSTEHGEMMFTRVSGFYVSKVCLDELFQHVDHVVRVRVLGERTEVRNFWLTPKNLARYGDDLPELYLAFTINTVQILEVFNGTREAGQIAEVTQMGGGNLAILT